MRDLPWEEIYDREALARTFRPSSIPSQVLQSIAAAQRFREGDTNIEVSFRLYKKALADLPENARRFLNQTRLAEAEKLRNAPASEAVSVYGPLLDPLLQSSSTDVTQGGLNR